MKLKNLIAALLLIAGTAQNMMAQPAFTVGDRVMSESELSDTEPYLIYQPRNAALVTQEGSNFYTRDNTYTPVTDAKLFYFIRNDSGYIIKNYATDGYIRAKSDYFTSAENIDYATTHDLHFDETYGAIFPSGAEDNITYYWDRSSSRIHGNTTASSTTYVDFTFGTKTPSNHNAPAQEYVLYKVGPSTTSYTEFENKLINLGEAATLLTAGQWYVMKNCGRNGYAYEKTSEHKLYNRAAAPNGRATDYAGFLVRLVDGTDGNYYLQNGYGNFFGAFPQNSAVPTTAFSQEQITISQIGSNEGYFYLTGTSDGRILDCQENGYPVVGWGTDAPTATNSNAAWQFYPVTFVDSWNPTASEVYTINNTNSNRGALIYNPDASTKYVWSSGKSGTFNAYQANSQWVIYPTGTDGQYYLYNVGAGKFAIPTTGGTYNGYNWIFSSSAVAVKLVYQSDGTYKIHTVNGSIYAAVSNNYMGPIINYNDIGGNFTITKVNNADQSAAASAAVARLIRNQTALTTYPQTAGWYAIQVKSANSNANAVGRYLYPSATLYNGLYPLTFTGTVDIQPSISDATYFTHLDCMDWDNNYWQLPDGRYLVGNSSNKFPTPSSTPSAIIAGYDNGNYFKSSSNYYADPYTSSGTNFIGETSYKRTAYTVYPIDLAAAGLTAWQMVCDNAPETQEITCSRNDVNGLSTVYKNGYIFLPSDVTPEAEEFTLDGATSVTVDASNHTVAFAYDPNLAIVEGGIVVEQGWQTAGRDGEVKLLRVTAKPFKDATGTSMTISLKEGTVDNISKLTLYEADSSSPEVLSTGEGAPTLTVVDEVDVTTSTETLNIGNFTAGTHYYWIGATVKGDATLGSVLDAAVTDITYTCNDNETMLDLASIGDPADRGAMVFNTRSYPFLPRDNGSRVYRIPAMVVADDGSIVVACDKRYQSYTDIGGGHVIDIVIRRSTDGGKTWSEPITIAKGEGASNNERCGYGDPSLVKGKDGKLYCLYAAGNLGYFYGQKHVCMSTSTDNGVTWSSSESTPPTDLFATGAMKNSAPGEGNAGGYGLYDYFVTSGKGLYTSDGILMYLIPGQTLTSSNYNTLTEGTYWGAAADDYIFYSTDDGASWYLSQNPMIVGGDEAKIIEMNDGSLLGSIRKASSRRFNSATYTANGDGTLSFDFGTQWDNPQLSQPSQNNQDLIYYQREPKAGKTDVIIHSMTTGNHANFKLYYSTDQGQNWTEFLNVQTKGTRYVTMEKGGTEANPGSLYLFFEDQSLNAAGGYTDYNHYPLNFLEITREQLVQLIPALDEVPDHNAKEVKIVYGTTAETNYGTWDSSKTTWTSNDNSGLAGLKLEKSAGIFDKFSNWQSRYNLSYKMEPGTQTLTLTAPEGYIITGYSLQVARPFSKDYDYTLTAEDGTSVSIGAANAFFDLNVEGLQKKSTDITVTETGTETQNNYVAIANFIVQLTIPTIIPGDIYGDDGVNDTDVLYMVGYLVGTVSGEDINLDAADLTGDGNVTLADLTALINVLREN